MLILVDDTLPREISQILSILGYDVASFAELNIQSLTDERALDIARGHDCILTASTYPNPAEWYAVHEAMMRGGISIVQIRLPKVIDDPALDILRCVIARIEDWIISVEEGHALTIVSSNGTTLKYMSRETIADIVQQRRDVDEVYR